jgi:3D (Asp-Asp-Asp) domain-containing protein
LTLWEKTRAIGKKRKYGFRVGVIAVLAVCLCWCVIACLRAGAVIPLSMSFSMPQAEQDFPAQRRIEAGPELTVPDLDSELVDLLRQSTVASVADKVDKANVANDTDAHQPRWKTVRMRVTGYCACPRCCGSFSDGLTANMHKIRRGDTFVAADKRVPFGTEMIIPGYNSDRPVTVKDRGRLIRGNRLDVFFNNHRTAQKWGARYVDVLVKVED